MSYNQNAGYGQALLNMVAQQVPAFGRVFVVMNSSNTDEENYTRIQDIFPPDPNGQVRFFTSLSDAYDAAESNNNDVILLDANSSHTLANGIAWSKNRIHVIGMDGGDRLIQQGAKVQSTDGAGDAYVIKVTGVRNSFRNVKFIQADTDAAALTVLQEGGEGTLYKNCSFVFGVADNLDGTTAHEVLAGSDSGTYINCCFGNDTLLTSAARSVFHIDQVTSSQEFKSNILRDCIFQISSSSATATFIATAAAGDILFSNLFENCSMVASIDSAGGAALTRAVISSNGITKGTLNFKDCAVLGATDFGTNGTNNDGILVYGAVCTGTDIVGIAPTAT